MRTPALILIVLWLVGCASTPTAMRNVAVEYRFENVRIAPDNSEWATIEGVLKRYVKTVDAEVVRERKVGDASFRSYRTRIVVPDLAAFESIHADLEALRLSPRSEQRVDYRFDGITAAYRSSYVTAGVSAVVSGFTVEGNRVKVFTQPKGEAIATNTVRPGMWSARLDGVPEERWVYGVSEDPKGALPRRYFRVNVTTLQTENLEQSAFEGWYGGPVK